MTVFYSEADFVLYQQLLRKAADRHGLAVLAYCLMPNHVHLIVEPSHPAAMSKALGAAHRQFAEILHRRERWSGHLWQARFYSCPLDALHLLHAVRYVLLNPVRAGLVGEPTAWKFSSARAHLYGEADALVSPGPLRSRIDDWSSLLELPVQHDELESIRRVTRAGRLHPAAPMGRPWRQTEPEDRRETPVT
jgi:putative transposase